MKSTQRHQAERRLLDARDDVTIGEFGGPNAPISGCYEPPVAILDCETKQGSAGWRRHAHYLT